MRVNGANIKFAADAGLVPVKSNLLWIMGDRVMSSYEVLAKRSLSCLFGIHLLTFILTTPGFRYGEISRNTNDRRGFNRVHHQPNDFIIGDADVYDKWTQALGSSAVLIRQTANRHEENSDEVISSAILPLLVVANDTLWFADYSEDWVLIEHPRQVNETTLFVGRRYPQPMGFRSSFTISHLQICTKAGIEALLTKIASDDNYWELLLPQWKILNAAAESD